MLSIYCTGKHKTGFDWEHFMGIRSEIIVFFLFLLHTFRRLKGLCDNVDSGPEQFQDHEICFSLRMPNQTVGHGG